MSFNASRHYAVCTIALVCLLGGQTGEAVAGPASGASVPTANGNSVSVSVTPLVSPLATPGNPLYDIRVTIGATSGAGFTVLSAGAFLSNTVLNQDPALTQRTPIQGQTVDAPTNGGQAVLPSTLTFPPPPRGPGVYSVTATATFFRPGYVTYIPGTYIPTGYVSPTTETCAIIVDFTVP